MAGVYQLLKTVGMKRSLWARWLSASIRCRMRSMALWPGLGDHLQA